MPNIGSSLENGFKKEEEKDEKLLGENRRPSGKSLQKSFEDDYSRSKE